MLVLKYETSKKEGYKKEIVDFYLQHLDRMNNWDLVDSSAYKILGPWLLDKNKDILYELAESRNLWKQRVAIMATYYFIKQGHFEDTLRIAEMLVNHEHDLIHKAVGWMLREIGNRDRNVEENFLKKHYKHMPRTMLRYAIEKFKPELRKQYLNGEV
jgi:3-methyladenine DNA glycosylase AlkD